VIVARYESQAQDMGALPAAVPVTPSRAAETNAAGEMPDLRGLSAREALRTLTHIGLTPRISGSGFVIDQSPEAGSPLVRGDACILKLGRRPAAPAGGNRP